MVFMGQLLSTGTAAMSLSVPVLLGNSPTARATATARAAHGAVALNGLPNPRLKAYNGGMKRTILSFALLVTLATTASGRFVTLHVNASSGPQILTDSLSVGTNELAKVVSASSPSFTFKMVHSGVTNLVSFTDAAAYPMVLTGPVTFLLGG